MAKKPTAKSETPMMLMAIVQAQDADVVVEKLDELDISITRLPSVGAFLGRKNATLLVGLPPSKQADIMTAFKDNCRQRVEYIAVPLESAPLPLPSPTPITVGGATIFALDIEHFEEL